MTEVQRLAAFVTRVTDEDLTEEARSALKAHVLDALGCAIGALDGEPIAALGAQLDEFGGNPLTTLIGGGKTAPDRAAFYNGALGLSATQTAHAIAMASVANNALRVTRTGALSHWKGLAYPNTALSATHAAFLAMRGITGPLEVFEGNKGFMEAIAGPFMIDWQAERLDVVPRTILKKYNAEIHSQSAIEGMLELRDTYHLRPEEVVRIELATFDVAFHIIGGGEEGSKHRVRTKEEADHSLPYLLAVALLDGEVTPAQYAPERISRSDVQALLQKVVVRPDPTLSRRFPEEMPARR